MSERPVPVLFSGKDTCCACGACLNICPMDAVSMEEDDCGFRYPKIDESRCVRCGRCKAVCAFQHTDVPNSPVATFAAVARDRELASRSASGGIFAALAKKIAAQGGVVFGAAMEPDFSVCHRACEQDSLAVLQGSKYTQSDTALTFREAKAALEQGKTVLYSGTPCQIDGLKSFLGRDYTNLLTADIICHGVPNGRMFREYIDSLGKAHGGAVEHFTFRDKRIGWGENGSAVIGGKRVKIWQSGASYPYYFSHGDLQRESCYRCPYACSHRPADLTLGDFWGIEKQHPEYLGRGGWDESEGISVVVANTKKGEDFLAVCDDMIDCKPSTFEKAAAGNAQLCRPVAGGKRDEIMQTYRDGGWDALEKRYESNIGFHKHASRVKSMLPKALKRKLKAGKK